MVAVAAAAGAEVMAIAVAEAMEAMTAAMVAARVNGSLSTAHDRFPFY